MSKKHIFLSIFSKITIFACVFCVFSACADTTTCDIDYTPVIGNSIQNGTPTPENPVEVISVGDKTVNLFDKNDLATLGSPWCQSNYISVKPNTTYICIDVTPSGSAGVREYTSNKTEILFTPYGSVVRGGTFTFTTSSTTTYVKVNINNDRLDSYMFVEGSTAPTSYIPYGYQIPVVGTSTNGSRTTTSVYLNAPLRKVGNYADVLDYKNGTITRNVGVKVLDGTEDWAFLPESASPVFRNRYPDVSTSIYTKPALSTHYEWENVFWGQAGKTKKFAFGANGWLYISQDNFATVEDFKAYLASEYANGTPVTVYYPLATPVVEQIENWSCIPPITDIKIATTKFVDEEFKAAEDQLVATVQTIESVVSRTIAQTGQIQVLQDTKQTRPDESCPANMKCLLVQDEDGTPHWYPIIEP